jgi:hypothetical protein
VLSKKQKKTKQNQTQQTCNDSISTWLECLLKKISAGEDVVKRNSKLWWEHKLVQPPEQ